MNQRIYKTLEFDKIINLLVESAESESGKQLTAKILPVNSLDEINRRQEETAEAVSLIRRRGSPSLSGIYNIKNIVKRLEIGAILNTTELLMIGHSLKAARTLKAYISEELENQYLGAVAYRIQNLYSKRTLEDKIFKIIISEDEIDDRASSSLLSIRRHILSQQNSIREKLSSIIRSSRYQKFIQEPVVTIRQDRYCIPVKQECKNEVPGLIHDASSSGATIFVEPMSVVEANNDIKQLRIKEKLEIERILAELTAEVSECQTDLLYNLENMTELDFIFAKAKLSLSYNGINPKINTEKRIDLKKARHPLIDKTKVVPIDFRIGKDFQTVVVTGPNTGGKTVTLKTVGLLTLMTQAGLHIPAAEGTETAIFDEIFADIGDEQSIEQNLSTFSGHMKNIVSILHEVNSQSLVLFDELGAGTDPSEGAALATSILDHLKNEHVTTVATTHYSELKIYAMTKEGVCNACCEFDIETLMPTYRLLLGIPGKSNAFAIASKLGLPEKILNMAREYITQDEIKMEDMLYAIQKNLDEANKNRIESQERLGEIEKEQSYILEKKEKNERDKERIIREAKEEALKIIRGAKEESAVILKEMQNLRLNGATKENLRQVEQYNASIKNAESEIESSIEPKWKTHQNANPPTDLKVGESVIILNLNQEATVLSLENKDGNLQVLAGIMKLTVPITGIRRVKSKEAKSGVSARGIAVSKTQHIKSEIDVRGLNLDEATDIVDKYLDDASMAGLVDVRIIHGKGTGVLRSGLHQHFKRHSQVDSYRLGVFGEGENGVTIVTLK